MSENMVYAAFFFPAAGGVLIFAMKYLSDLSDLAQARLKQDDTYRALAVRMAAAQDETAAALADIQARLAGIEKILKDVG